MCAVDPDHPGLNLCCDAMSTLQIVGEDSGPEAVSRVVCGVDGFFFVREAGDDDHRTCNILSACHPHTAIGER